MESPSDDTDVPSQPDNASDDGEVEVQSDEEDEGGERGSTGGDRGNGAGDQHSSSPTRTIKASPNLDRLYGLREIGKEALCWQLSSAKPGNGVEQIRDESIDTYWQSDGNSQPHFIQVHFGRRVAISYVCLYLDYNLDESYTPKRIQVQVGMTNQDLISALYPPQMQIELQEPVGWCIIPLSSPPDPLQAVVGEEEEEENGGSTGLVRAHLLRISILSMHQNGRDTHVRQVQLYGPRMHTTPLSSSSNNNLNSSSNKKPGELDTGVLSTLSTFATIR